MIVGKEMIEERINLDLNKLVQELSTPCKLIFAGNYNKHELWKPYIEEFKTKPEQVIVDWATHGFIEEWTEQKLFEETLKFL